MLYSVFYDESLQVHDHFGTLSLLYMLLDRDDQRKFAGMTFNSIIVYNCIEKPYTNKVERS